MISTVNVQHLESLNDAIFELTGVRVRETFPDRILDDADEVVLVDLSPEELRERLRAGKVYPKERADGRSRELLQEGQPGRAAGAGPPRGRRGRRGSPPAPDPRAAQQAGRRRADPGPDRAAGEVAADPPACVAIRAAARRGDRLALGPAAGLRADRRRDDPACGAQAPGECPRDPLPGGGRRRSGRGGPARRRRTRLHIRVRGHARRAPARGDHPRVAAVADGP